jgi:chemotaxis signal transduction protein
LSIVCFRTPAGLCGLPIEHVEEIRSSDGMVPLPAPRAGVAGLLPWGEESLSVLSVLGSEGEHVIVVDDDDLRFGLLVEEALGIEKVDESTIGPAPEGQDRAVVSGVVTNDLGLVLLVDLTVLRGRLVG